MLADEVSILRHRAALAIGRMCVDNQDSVQLLLNIDTGLDALTTLLQDDSMDVRRSTTWSLGVLCRRQNPAAQDGLVVRPSAMKSIVGCLADRDVQVRQNAAWLVGCACDQHAGNQQLFGETEQGFMHLAALLSAEERQIGRAHV